MKTLLKIVVVLASFSLAHAQQYGWVRVAQLGNQSTGLQAVEFVDSLHGWTASDSIYKTTDGGNTWISYYPAAGFIIRSISMADKINGWAAGYSGSFGGIIRTTNSGLSWFQQRYLINRNYYGTATQSIIRNTTSGYARNSPDTGKVVQTTNSGTTWTERTIADGIIQLRKVQFVDSLHGWITTFGPGGVLKTTDGGESWAQVSTTPLFTAISFIDTMNGYGIGAKTVFRTTNGGMSWAVLANVGTQNEDFSSAAISFVDSLHGCAFGLIFFQGDLAAAIYRTTDGGLSWSRELAGGGAQHINDGIMLDPYHGWAVGDFGSVFAYRLVSSVPEQLDRVPRSFALKQNYPNPFNPSTAIEYEILDRSYVVLKVYDVNGKEVHVLVNQEHEPGVYRIQFNASGLSSGTYYCRLETPTYNETKQMVLIK